MNFPIIQELCLQTWWGNGQGYQSTSVRHTKFLTIPKEGRASENSILWEDTHNKKCPLSEIL